MSLWELAGQPWSSLLKNQVVQKAGGRRGTAGADPTRHPWARACCSNCRLGVLRLDPGILILFLVSGCKGPNVMPRGVLLPARECLLSVLAGLLSFCLPSPTYLVRSKFPGCKVHPNVRAWIATYQPTSLPQLPPSQGSQKENHRALACKSIHRIEKTPTAVNSSSKCSEQPQEQGWAQTLLREQRPY